MSRTGNRCWASTPIAKLADGRVPGSHASDADLYISRYLAHHIFRAPPPVKPGSVAREREAENTPSR